MKARNFKIILVLHAALFLFSCADNEMEQLTVVKPTTIANYDYLKEYEPLREYQEHLGVTITPKALQAGGMEYRIAVSNFSELLPTSVYSHARMIKANGSIDTTTALAVQSIAQTMSMPIVATPLLSHQQQNTTYLLSLLQPNVLRPEGDDGGYCLKMSNSSILSKATDAQVLYTFAKTPQVEPGISYKLKMMVRGTAAGIVQVATYSNGKGSRFTPDMQVTTEWTKVEMTNVIATGIKGLTSIVFNIGNYAGTLYVDDIELVEWNTTKQKEIGKNLNTSNTNLDDPALTAKSISVLTNEGNSIDEAVCSDLGDGFDPLATYIEKTAAEKQTILENEIEHYLDKVMTLGGHIVSDWVVVSNALSTVTNNGNLFYWQQYLGAAPYVTTAFTSAARYTNGKLYIGEDSLENNLTKTQQLVTLIEQAETAGARIDGIALNIASNTETTDMTIVSQVFEKLVATGKLIRIISLSVTIGDEVITDDVTEEQMVQQAATAKGIIEAYLDKVPVEQRGGIAFRQILDNEQPLGLWDKNYNRKHIFGGICNAIINQ